MLTFEEYKNNKRDTHRTRQKVTENRERENHKMERDNHLLPSVL